MAEEKWGERQKGEEGGETVVSMQNYFLKSISTYRQKQSKKEIKKTIPFKKICENSKILKNKLNRRIKDLITEKYKILMKEIEKSHRWKDVLCL